MFRVGDKFKMKLSGDRVFTVVEVASGFVGFDKPVTINGRSTVTPKTADYWLKEGIIMRLDEPEMKSVVRIRIDELRRLAKNGAFVAMRPEDIRPGLPVFVAPPPKVSPKVECGCGKHQIDPDGDLHAQHRDWSIDFFGPEGEASYGLTTGPVSGVRGVGISDRYEPQVDDQYGEEFEI